MIYDFHVHSENSFDSKESIFRVCEAAIKKGVTDLAFVEHYSVNPKRKTFGSLDFHKYSSEIKNARELFKDKLKIYMGLELCEPHIMKETLKSDIDKKNLDFILGSVHNVNDTGFRTILRQLKSKKCYDLYFEDVFKMASHGDFDVAAHLDLMNRYAFDVIGNYNFQNYEIIIKDILSILISRNKGIEINTSGLRNSLQDIHPKLEILKLYKSLGGEIITIGSDSHISEDVGSGCDAALNLLKELEFKYIFTFENREPLAHKIL